MYLLTPISSNSRVVIVTRFSREEQRRQSTADQFDYCREFLSEQVELHNSVQQISDEGVSGELRDRPGIRELRNLICTRQVDLMICEDSSRLFRGIALCLELVGLAVDHDIRVICINDHVDTANEDWQNRLEEAQRHHGQDNYYTRFRIKRAHDGLWKLNAAIGPKRPGYLRKRSVPASSKSPKFDEVDPKWKKTIVRVYELIARGDHPDAVAKFLTECELPKTNNSLIADWTDRNVISLIRCPKYRGQEVFRNEISKKHYASGKSKSVRNPDPRKVLTRDMPHLRIVEDALWYRANKAIDDRQLCQNRPSGVDHPLFAIPRDSRSPLSNIFFCGICGSKMHMEGRNEGGYRCSAARRGKCWNKATALRDLTHQRIGSAVSNEILDASEAAIPELLMLAERQLLDPNQLEREKAELTKRKQAMEKQQERLAKVIMSQDDPPEFLDKQLAELRRQAESLSYEQSLLQQRMSKHVEIPTRAKLRESLEQQSATLSICDRSAGALLKQLLAGSIRAIPCQQFDSNKVVLRAELKLNLVELLPGQISAHVQSHVASESGQSILQRKIFVELFEPSIAPKYAMCALDRFQHDPDNPPTLEQLGHELGISKRSAHLALQMGKGLEAAGLADPFIPLTECPKNPSRWKLTPSSRAFRKQTI